MEQVRSWTDVTPDIFNKEIRVLAEPAVLRGLVSDWPMVAASHGKPLAPFAVTEFLGEPAINEPIEFVLAPPESQGLLHYQPDMRAFTYSKHSAPFAQVIAALAAETGDDGAPTIAIQSLDIDRHFPVFPAGHRMPLLPPDVAPRIWIGNRAKVATHNDPLENIACVAAGHRRFTLFPPEQIGNLYMGPLHVTPAGTPISMVHVTAPDLERFPRFATALEFAMVADLEPGDAIYIPYQWFHHVEALDPFNVLVNYWWNDAPQDGGSPWDAMLHAIMSLRHLPAPQRRAWLAMFRHYAFLVDGDPAEHLPPYAAGILGANSPEDRLAMRRQLLTNLAGKN